MTRATAIGRVEPAPIGGSPSARELLAPYLQHRTYRAGELLWRQGDSDGMFVAVESGRIKVFRALPNGSSVTVYLFGPGHEFGFMPLIDGCPFPVSAQALTDVEALVVPRSEFVEAVERNPGVAFAVMRLLVARLREAFDRIERSSIPEVLPRVATALASLLSPRAHHGLDIIELPLRSRELAGALGLAPESFSRGITKLVRSGVLHRLGPRRYQVLDASALRRAMNSPAIRARARSSKSYTSGT